jgi:hypothetical protein
VQAHLGEHRLDKVLPGSAHGPGTALRLSGFIAGGIRAVLAPTVLSALAPALMPPRARGHARP